MSDKKRSGEPVVIDGDVHLPPDVFAIGKANLAHANELARGGNNRMETLICDAADELRKQRKEASRKRRGRRKGAIGSRRRVIEQRITDGHENDAIARELDVTADYVQSLRRRLSDNTTTSDG